MPTIHVLPLLYIVMVTSFISNIVVNNHDYDDFVASVVHVSVARVLEIARIGNLDIHFVVYLRETLLDL